MPADWVHAIIDLFAYDLPHLALHQWKDAPAQWLGAAHRTERHDWYNAGKADVWSLDRPIPPYLKGSIHAMANAHGDDAAERFMVDLSHDYRDLFWDEASPRDRLLIEGLSRGSCLGPTLLRQYSASTSWKDSTTTTRSSRGR